MQRRERGSVTSGEPPDGVERRNWQARAAAAELFAEHEHRRAEDATERLRRRTMLFARAEHKVKNTMTVVAGAADTLAQHWDAMSAAQRTELLGAIRRSAAAAVTEAESLLAQTRSEAEIVGVDPVLVDVVAALGPAVGDARHMTSRHDISLVAAGPVEAYIDPADFHQIVGHLLENAIKYSPAGGSITVSATVRDDRAVVVVRDEGVGVPEGVDIFAPFERGRFSGSEVPGSGLGLYVVRSLTERIGATVTAAPNPDGPGSTFELVLRT